MKTEMTTTSSVGEPISISWNHNVKLLNTADKWQQVIYYTKQEAIELRDFLIQLNLGK